MRALPIVIVIAAVVVAASCGGEDPGPPFACGTMMCNGDQACINSVDSTGGRDDYSCAEDRGCTDALTAYCPGALSAFCTSLEPNDAAPGTDGGVRMVTRVRCTYAPP